MPSNALGPNVFSSLRRINEIDWYSDVHSDPFALEPLSHGNGRPTTAVGVENNVAFVAARRDNAFQQGFRLLRRIAEPFLCRRRYERD